MPHLRRIMTIDGSDVSRCANVTIISAEYSLALAGTVHSAIYRASPTGNAISIYLAASENFGKTVRILVERAFVGTSVLFDSA